MLNKLIASGFGKAAILFAVAMISLSATVVKNKEEKFSKASMKVKFLGGDNDRLKFNVKYETKSATTFRLVAISEDGEVWFEDSFQASGDFEKKLSIPRLTATEYITFLLKTAKDKNDLTYKVRIPTRVGDM
jgi:hypothetical protein